MKPKKLHYAWVILIGCCLFAFVAQGMILGTIGTYMTPIATSLGVGQTQVSMAMTFQMLGIAIAMPIIGGLIHKVPLKMLTAGSVLLIAAGLTMASCANSVIVLYAAWLIIGASMSMVLMLPILIGNWFSAKLGIAMGISTAIASAGSAVFNPLSGMLVANYGWRFSYRLSAVVLLVILIPVALFLLRFAPGEGETAYGADHTDTTRRAGQAYGANDGLTLKQASRTSLFYIVLLATALFSAFTSMGQQVVPHLMSRDFQPALAASAISCLSIGSAMGKLAIGPFLDGKHRTGIITLLAIAGSVGWMSIALAPSVAGVFVGGLICGLGQSVGMVALPYFSRRFFGGKDMGKISGISGAVCTLVPAVGVLLSASVFDSTGSYTPVFLFAGVVSLALTVAVLACYGRSMKRRAALVCEA